MRRIFAIKYLYVDGEHAFESFLPVIKTETFLAQWNFDGEPKARNWATHPAFAEPGDGHAPEADFPAVIYGCLPIQVRTYEKLAPLFNSLGEVLDLHITDGRSLKVLHPFPNYDCLDNERTTGKKFESGRWMLIDQYVFHRDRVPAVPVFKIPGDSSIFCTEEFCDIVASQNLTGLKFREAWNETDGPVEHFGWIKNADRFEE